MADTNLRSLDRFMLAATELQMTAAQAVARAQANGDEQIILITDSDILTAAENWTTDDDLSADYEQIRDALFSWVMAEDNWHGLK